MGLTRIADAARFFETWRSAFAIAPQDGEPAR
jgi:hypothetical protein